MRAGHRGAADGAVPTLFQWVGGQDAYPRSSDIHFGTPVAEISQGVIHVCTAGRSRSTVGQTVEISQRANRQHIVKAARAVVIGVIILVAGGYGESHPGIDRALDGIILRLAETLTTQAHVGDFDGTSISCYPVDASDNPRAVAAAALIEHLNRPQARSRCDTHHAITIVNSADRAGHMRAMVMVIISTCCAIGVKN